MPERIAVHQFYRVVNAYAADFNRIGQWIDMVDRDDAPDLRKPRLVLRFSDNKRGAFEKDELEACDGYV